MNRCLQITQNESPLVFKENHSSQEPHILLADVERSIDGSDHVNKGDRFINKFIFRKACSKLLQQRYCLALICILLVSQMKAHAMNWAYRYGAAGFEEADVLFFYFVEVLDGIAEERIQIQGDEAAVHLEVNGSGIAPAGITYHVAAQIRLRFILENGQWLLKSSAYDM